MSTGPDDQALASSRSLGAVWATVRSRATSATVTFRSAWLSPAVDACSAP